MKGRVGISNFEYRICRPGRHALLLLLALVLPAPAQPEPEPENGQRRVNFSYDQVDIRILARTVGMSTGRRFVVDDAVTGKVTVVTPEPVSADEVYPLFVSVLESSGYSVIEKNGLSHVVALPEASGAVGRVVGANEVLSGSGLITKIRLLQHIGASEVRKALEDMVRGGKEGSLRAVPSTNHLLITDTVENVRRLEQIVDELDRPGAASKVQVIPLKYASAREVALQVTQAMRGAESAGSALSRQMRQATEGGASLPSGFTAVAAEDANSLLVVGTPVQLEETVRIIALLDVEGETGTGRLNAIFLKYITASEAAEDLNAILAKRSDPKEGVEVAIEANESNNALIVDASPRDFKLIRSLVEQLDQYPEQVLVEILIAEVASGATLDLGVEFSTIDVPEKGVTTAIGRSRPGETDAILDLISQGVFPQGLSIGVAHGTVTLLDGTVAPAIPILITALAENRDVKIRSNVPLLAQNNKEAIVSVVDNIPVLTSTIEGGSGTARDVIQNIERIDVGIQLKVTPHVNPDGQILMELNATIEAIVDQSDPNTPFTPTIAKREVKTTVTVPDNRTVVISGLIREDQVQTVSKVPFLGDIPILGALFRRSVDRTQRTNLLILVTPHIVTDLEDADRMREEYERRTQLLGITNRYNRAAPQVD